MAESIQRPRQQAARRREREASELRELREQRESGDESSSSSSVPSELNEPVAKRAWWGRLTRRWWFPLALMAWFWLPTQAWIVRVAYAMRSAECVAVPWAFFALAACRLAVASCMSRVVFLHVRPAGATRSLVAVARSIMTWNDATGCALMGEACAYVFLTCLLIVDAQARCGDAATGRVAFLLLAWVVYGPTSTYLVHRAVRRVAQTGPLRRFRGQTHLWSVACVMILAGVALFGLFIVFLVATFVGLSQPM